MFQGIDIYRAPCVPDLLPSAVVALDFRTIKRHLLEHSGANALSHDEAQLLELEYRKFLALRVWHPDADLVPSEGVDRFWHAHILHTEAYVRDCYAVFGQYLHHEPALTVASAYSRHELEDALQNTIALYEVHFGAEPDSVVAAARCKGKKCHAPTQCRCRSADTTDRNVTFGASVGRTY